MDRGAEDERMQASTSPAPLTAWWLGRTRYRDAWDLQHRMVEARIAGSIGDQLLLLEHEPVLTLGRHSDPSHVLATPAELAARGIELIQTERGGEVTYHGPGQLTAYTIIRLPDRGLLVRPLVRAMEAALSETCAAFGVEAGPRDGFPGCWCGGSRKIGAIGVRIEHGVSYHGIALNVTVRLGDFDLIDACGLPEVESTSIARESGSRPNRRSSPWRGRPRPLPGLWQPRSAPRLPEFFHRTPIRLRPGPTWRRCSPPEFRRRLVPQLPPEPPIEPTPQR